MAKDVSIAFKASDNLTHSISQMRKSVSGLSRDVSEYRKVQNEAFEKKTEVKLDITKAKQELKELERAVKQNVEGSEQVFKEKQKTLEELQEEYRRLTQVAKDASKAERQLQEDISKSSNANASRTSGTDGTSSIMSSLANAGLGAMLGGAVSNNLNQSITSMFGQTTGSVISSIVGGVATGAAMGSIAGPIGTAVGAAVGGLTGSINALTERQEKGDDLFRGEVRSIFDNVKQTEQQSLDNGIVLAAKREKDMISYSTLLGSTENANRFLEDVQKFAAKTPFETNNLLDTSKVMLSYGYKQDEILPMMTKIGDASSALGIDTANQQVVATALGRMKSSGKTSLEYLSQLTERAIPAIDYLAEAFGTSNKKIYEMISKGTIDGAKASEIIVDAMGKQFAGNMEKQSATYDGYMSSLQDAYELIDQAMGMGYTEERKKGLMEEEKRLDGGMSEQMQEANKLIGKYKADLENQYQQSIMDAIHNTMTDNSDYIEAQKNGEGAEMGRILAEARAKAEIEYKNSEGYRLQLEADKSLVENIQDAMLQDGGYLRYGEKMAKQFERGWSGSIDDAARRGVFTPQQIRDISNEHGAWWQKNPTQISKSESNPAALPKYLTGNSEQSTTNTYNGMPRHATGLDRVPYNDYPFLAHEGERILTKLEADKLDKEGQKQSPVINISVYNNGDPYEITQEICNQIVKASENYAGG